MIKNISPLGPGTPGEATFESRLPEIFSKRREYCKTREELFTIDLDMLLKENWGGGEYVEKAIKSRLETIKRLGVFLSGTQTTDQQSFKEHYEGACQEKPIVFDMRDLSSTLRQALVRSVSQKLEAVCGSETKSGKGRYPFVFFEEAHFYVSEATIINIITRGRHIGMGSIFVTNTPQKLPDTVFRQLDNLFLLSLTHKDDIRNVSKSSFTDEATIESFATRMPERHALIVGNVTDRYPLVVRVEDLPAGVPRSGQTRSTWDRFNEQQTVQTQPIADPLSDMGEFDDLDDPFADD